jgi:hypothetical protein
MMRRSTAAALLALVAPGAARPAAADGMVVAVSTPPGQYAGSVEERAQEAVIVFHGSETPGGAVEDLILKISVQGDAKAFGWIVPFPAEPAMAKENPAIFRELHDYVERRLYALRMKAAVPSAGDRAVPAAPAAAEPVEVLARKVVGVYDIAVVRENAEGGLEGWLEKERYRKPANAGDVIGFYRKKGYVFACLKVSDAELDKDRPVDLHPVRFTFKTGGRDGIFFPMKLTGLQQAPFDVNLHVFLKSWINDKLSKYGYVHRGFRLRHRDWDTAACVANGGKAWSAPETDPYLKNLAETIPTVTRLFQKLHPGEKYYLTTLQARGLKPDDVRHWSDDLWLFPYYTDTSFVPFDARPGGPAALGW